ncbi:hypothetical protein ACB092_12G192600 [Castanea dentata]
MDAELFNAAIRGDDSFFEPNVSLNLNRQVTAQGNSVLHVAVKHGKEQNAEKILRFHPSLLYRRNSKGDTPLLVAARLVRLKMTQVLINRPRTEVEVGRNHELLRMGNLEKDTALHDAVRNGHFDIVELLIRELHPRLTSLTNNAEESPLFLAVDRAFYKIALHILEEAVDVPGCSYGGRNKMNVLHVAVIGTGQVKKKSYKLFYKLLISSYHYCSQYNHVLQNLNYSAHKHVRSTIILK